MMAAGMILMKLSRSDGEGKTVPGGTRFLICEWGKPPPSFSFQSLSQER